MINSDKQFDTDTTLVRAPVVGRVQRWWIFAFIVSLIVFSSALLFLSAEAQAKPKGGGGSGGGDPVGGNLHSVGSGGGSSGGDGGGGHRAAPAGETNGPRIGEFSGDIGGGRNGGAGSGGDSPIGGTLDSGASEQQVQQAAKQLDQQTSEPPLQQAKGAMADSRQFVEPALSAVKQTANDTHNQLSETTQPVLNGAQKQLDNVARPVLNTAEQALAPAKQPVEQVLDPVEQTLGLPTQQASEPPVQQQVLAPAQRALDPAIGPDRWALVPVLGEATSLLAITPILRDQLALPQSTDSRASQLVTNTSSVLGAAKIISLDSSGSTTLPATLSDFEGFSGKPLVERRQGITAAPPSINEHPLVFDPARAQSVLSQVPQPFSAGAIPAAGSSTGGSGSGSSGGSSGGLDLGALALLPILLLSGKFLWSIRDFLKPSTALIPILERPG